MKPLGITRGGRNESTSAHQEFPDRITELIDNIPVHPMLTTQRLALPCHSLPARSCTTAGSRNSGISSSLPLTTNASPFTSSGAQITARQSGCYASTSAKSFTVWVPNSIATVSCDTPSSTPCSNRMSPRQSVLSRSHVRHLVAVPERPFAVLPSFPPVKEVRPKRNESDGNGASGRARCYRRKFRAQLESMFLRCVVVHHQL